MAWSFDQIAQKKYPDKQQIPDGHPLTDTDKATDAARRDKRQKD